MKRALQYFTKEYLEQCRKLTLKQRLEFLENYRKLAFAAQNSKHRSKLISLKIEQDLLELFRHKAELHGVPYQTQIKRLMREWTIK